MTSFFSRTFMVVLGLLFSITQVCSWKPVLNDDRIARNNISVSDLPEPMTSLYSNDHRSKNSEIANLKNHSEVIENGSPIVTSVADERIPIDMLGTLPVQVEYTSLDLDGEAINAGYEADEQDDNENDYLVMLSSNSFETSTNALSTKVTHLENTSNNYDTVMSVAPHLEVPEDGDQQSTEFESEAGAIGTTQNGATVESTTLTAISFSNATTSQPSKEAEQQPTAFRPETADELYIHHTEHESPVPKVFGPYQPVDNDLPNEEISTSISTDRVFSFTFAKNNSSSVPQASDIVTDYFEEEENGISTTTVVTSAEEVSFSPHQSLTSTYHQEKYAPETPLAQEESTTIDSTHKLSTVAITLRGTISNVEHQTENDVIATNSTAEMSSASPEEEFFNNEQVNPETTITYFPTNTPTDTSKQSITDTPLQTQSLTEAIPIPEEISTTFPGEIDVQHLPGTTEAVTSVFTETTSTTSTPSFSTWGPTVAYEETFKCTHSGIFADPNSCNTYHVCQRIIYWKLHIRKRCWFGFHFHSTWKICVPRRMSDCKDALHSTFLTNKQQSADKEVDDAASFLSINGKEEIVENDSESSDENISD